MQLHIPKTGGVSLRTLLAGRFDAARVVYVRGSEPGRKAQLEQAALAHPLFVTGHFGFELVARMFPEAPVVTLLREPVARALSAYGHLRTLDPATVEDEAFRREIGRAHRQDLRQYLESDPAAAADHLGNVQTWHLGCDGAFRRDVARLGRDDLERARRNLRRCVAVGVTEQFAAAAAALCAALHWEPFALLPHDNRGSSALHVELDAPAAAMLAEMTRLDRELYQCALDELERRARPPATAGA